MTVKSKPKPEFIFSTWEKEQLQMKIGAGGESDDYQRGKTDFISGETIQNPTRHSGRQEK